METQKITRHEKSMQINHHIHDHIVKNKSIKSNDHGISQLHQRKIPNNNHIQKQIIKTQFKIITLNEY